MFSFQVTVVTEGKTDFKKWAWEGIHNVINAAKTDNSKLMCYAHSKKSNYGILGISNYKITNKCISGVMVSMLASIAVEH